ncbi:MAG: HAMP domain-containing protein [Gammaproteobacteria bacterium]|nr:HAMP domain-containing protein [Gammaproteobacteria bacterium]MCP4880893.1 HAMP domain-containing protein [Gammaproteobacteria bacterium]
MPLFKKSIIARIGAAMFAVSLMALVSMVGSVLVAQNTQGDAGAINLAGSLRMMSYKLVADASDHIYQPSSVNASVLQADLADFEQRLNSQILSSVITKDGAINLYNHYQNLQKQWFSDIKPRYLAGIEEKISTAQLTAIMTPFVNNIDAMVMLLEKSTESKIKLLSLVQGISLVMTIIIILVAMLDINNNVIRPLKQLVTLAKLASSGNLSGRLDYQSEDELGLLSNTYNRMAEELQKIYNDLEQRVESKTSELQKTNEALQLLYNTNRSLNRQEDICQRFMPVMQQLETISNFGPISLTLTDSNKQAYRELITTSPERPNTCINTDCYRCLGNQIDERPHQAMTLPIQVQETYFGEIRAQFLPDQPPSNEEIKLVETIVENLGTSLSLERKASQDQHMSLIEERSVIARELHDSLAQSLSYLKIQVARLGMMRKQDAKESQMDEVVMELKEGLNNAYRQLRELLSTFRLKLDIPGLGPALDATIEEFSERLGFIIDSQYRIHHLNLTANEEIHVLQIIREALANIVKHSNCNEASVLVEAEQSKVSVTICDNGLGLPDHQDMANHYGLVIMQDRTASLGGELSIENQSSGGVRVHVTFQTKSTLKEISHAG